MKKKALFITNNTDYFQAMSELFNFETDFEPLFHYKKTDEIDTRAVDLILVDDDIELITKLRDNGYKMAVIALINGDENKIFEALDKGASDAFLKPCIYESLMTRARMSIYLEEHTFDGAIIFAKFVFMPKTRILRYIDKEIKLTEKETDLINLLYTSKPNPVDRQTILKKVWGYNTGITTHTLETHIYHLRQKVESITGDKLIITVNDGYALNYR